MGMCIQKVNFVEYWLSFGALDNIEAIGILRVIMIASTVWLCFECFCLCEKEKYYTLLNNEKYMRMPLCKFANIVGIL